jgi:NADPH:quinone reductase-like Zn-dependent oxidoreductase
VRAWILDESPGSYREGALADPHVGPDDVRVRPLASALNHMDLWLARGLPRPPLPHVPGCDVAGVVESVGDDVSHVRPGDEVVVNPAVSPIEAVVTHGIDSPLGAGFQIVGEHRWGGHADLVVVPGRNVVARPAGRSWEECAAYPLATLTAWRMLRRARVAAGESVLVVGVGGGVSAAALALAQRLGATVFVTSRDEAKRRRAVAAGAADAFDSEADWPVAVDVVVESVGPATWDRSVKALRHGRAQPAPALLQADRDHRLDDGLVPRVRPGDPPGRPGPAGAGRRGVRPGRLPGRARPPPPGRATRKGRAPPPRLTHGLAH